VKFLGRSSNAEMFNLVFMFPEIGSFEALWQGLNYFA